MKTNHYIDNKKLNVEMTAYVKSYHEAVAEGNLPPRVNNYIGASLKMLAERLATSRNFSGYSYRDEMVGDAIENCLRYLHNFNPEKTKNPFAYFTQIMYYAFLRRIHKEKKQSYIKFKATHNSMVLPLIAELPAGEQQYFQGVLEQMGYDHLAAMSEKFESMEPKPKAPRKKKAAKGVETFVEPEESTDE